MKTLCMDFKIGGGTKINLSITWIFHELFEESSVLVTSLSAAPDLTSTVLQAVRAVVLAKWAGFVSCPICIIREQFCAPLKGVQCFHSSSENIWGPWFFSHQGTVLLAHLSAKCIITLTGASQGKAGDTPTNKSLLTGTIDTAGSSLYFLSSAPDSFHACSLPRITPFAPSVWGGFHCLPCMFCESLGFQTSFSCARCTPQ